MTIEEIEKAVSQLPPDELARFRAWFEEFEAARFDRKIEQDAASGRLDRLAEQALADYRQAKFMRNFSAGSPDSAASALWCPAVFSARGTRYTQPKRTGGIPCSAIAGNFSVPSPPPRRHPAARLHKP
jgi:hypothetical protein